MTGFGPDRFIAMFDAMAGEMERNRDHLCELDGAIGDADHGVAMALGFGAVRKALSEADPAPATPTEVFNAAAKAFLNAVGASSGPLYATAFLRAGATLKGKDAGDLADIARLIPAMAEGIEQRGKAAPGDKTMLDAWRPAADAALQVLDAGDPPEEALLIAADAAETGAMATRGMRARIGRAARLGDRSVGHVDPGAASAAMLVRAIAETFGKDPA